MAFTLPDWISAKPETYLRARESGAEAGLGAQRLRQSAQDSAVQHALESQRLASQQDIASQRAAQALAEMQLRQELEQHKAQSAAEKLAANTEYQDRTLALREDSLAAKRSADEFRQAQLESGLKLREEGLELRRTTSELQQKMAQQKLEEETAKKQATFENQQAQLKVIKAVESARREGKTGEEALNAAMADTESWAKLTPAQQGQARQAAMAQERRNPDEPSQLQIRRDYRTAKEKSLSMSEGKQVRQFYASEAARMEKDYPWLTEESPGKPTEPPSSLRTPSKLKILSITRE